MKFLGVDIGTTSLAVVVVDAASGNVIARWTALHGADLVGEESFERMQDADVIWRKTQTLIADATARFTDIGGIGISGQMHGILYVDAKGRAVSPLYTWQDGRTAVASPAGHTFAQWFAQRTGYQTAAGWGLVTHAALAASGAIPTGAAALCTIGDYVTLCLTGRARPLLHPSQAASLGCWTGSGLDLAALARVQIPPQWLPDCSAIGSALAVGQTQDGIPVYTAIGDNQASFLGAVTQETTSLLVNIGTGAQVSLWSAEVPSEVPAGWEVRPFVDGHYLLVGAVFNGGRAYATLERFFGRVIELFGTPQEHTAQHPAEHNLYGAMTAALDSWTKTGAWLTVDTQFAGTRDNPGARGSISGIGEDNWTPEHLIAGVLQGMAQELHALVAQLPEKRRTALTQLVGAGNAIRRNPHLVNALAQAFSLPVCLPKHEEEAARGAALYAGVAARYYSDAASAMRLLGE